MPPALVEAFIERLDAAGLAVHRGMTDVLKAMRLLKSDGLMRGQYVGYRQEAGVALGKRVLAPAIRKVSG